jgi:hypothetical protein
VGKGLALSNGVRGIRYGYEEKGRGNGRFVHSFKSRIYIYSEESIVIVVLIVVHLQPSRPYLPSAPGPQLPNIALERYPEPTYTGI